MSDTLDPRARFIPLDAAIAEAKKSGLLSIEELQALAISQPQAGELVVVGYVDPADTARKSSVGEPLRFWCSPVKTTCFSMPLYTSPQPANPAQGVSELLNRARYMVENPSAWETFDQGGSDIIAELIAAIGAGGQAVARVCAICGAPHDNDLLSDICQGCETSAPWRDDGQAVAEPRKGFPILGSGGQKIDWQLVADHGGQAQKNHYQSVERLAARGGLSWCELHAVLHDKPWQKMDENDAITACRALEARYLSALSQPHPADERVVEALRKIEYCLTKDSLCEAEKIDDALMSVRRLIAAKEGR